MSSRSPVFASYVPNKVTQQRKRSTVEYHKFLVHKMLSHSSSCFCEETFKHKLDSETPARSGLGIANGGRFLSRIQS